MKYILICLICLISAEVSGGPSNERADEFFKSIKPYPRPGLPEPITNNAIAVTRIGDQNFVLSALGLTDGKTWNNTRSAAWLVEINTDQPSVYEQFHDYDEQGEQRRRELEEITRPRWIQLPDVPGPVGRLASVAVAVRNKFLVIGGYTVAEDGAEVSINTVHELDPLDPMWIEKTPMPISVDDTVAVVYRDRYVYLISGWHDLGNVNLVQVYDVEDNSWSQATPFPGTPVFGHAGGIDGTTIVICDGVKIATKETGRREFVMSDECYRGEIDAENFKRITWNSLKSHPKPARYRMASTGHDGKIYFLGGSDNPYNYNGIGYDGNASNPVVGTLIYSIAENSWESRRFNELPNRRSAIERYKRHLNRLMADDTLTDRVRELKKSLIDQENYWSTMDHRGLMYLEGMDQLCTIGGMSEDQFVRFSWHCIDP